MRVRHLDAFRPICLHCLRSAQTQLPLQLTWSAGEVDGHILWGILGCARCGMEYPIVEGVPILVPDLRANIARSLHLLMMRDDLPPMVESLIGDAAGSGSMLDGVRQSMSSYGWDHFGDLDPDEETGDDTGAGRPGAVLRCLEEGIELLPEPPTGPVLDLGCGPGRASFALAERTDALVLGIDLNLPLVRLAARILRTGRVDYPRRRIGLVYDRRSFAADLPGAERVDFWAADAQALPLAEASAGLVSGLNLLDCLGTPSEGLATIGRVLKDGGQAILATPYDWSAGTTPVENWVGGHSQRGPEAGAAEPLLRALLDPARPGSSGLELVAEIEDQPWQVRMHARSIMRYSSHLVVARRRHRKA